MSVNFYPCEPGDDFEDDDWWDDEEEDEDEFTVEFVFGMPERQLNFVHTVGLWQLDLPELYLSPPADLSPGRPEENALRAVVLASGLMELGNQLIESETFEIPPCQINLDGRRVRFWLIGPEPTPTPLAVSLGPEVETVLRVDCSLWHASLLGDG